ncbi:MAG TPA: hypothetical protein PLP05_02720 [Sedimentisphaerales bacterium]|nr:hypothetical protein [Sedimentisphaerales bacterium]
MNRKDKLSKKNKNENIAASPDISRDNRGKKLKLQEYLDSLIELHKLQFVLLKHMDEEIK